MRYIHIHLWKTAGTTFLNICRRNFGSAFHREHCLLHEWHWSYEQMSKILSVNPWLKCYSAHMASGDYPRKINGEKILGIAFIRHPVDRLISAYQYQGQTRDNIWTGVDFSAFYKEVVTHDLWANGQAWIIGGSRDQSALDKIQKRIINGELIILPTERFKDACIALETLYPEDFKDCTFTSSNKSRHKYIPTAEQRSEITALMEIDINLHQLAIEFIDRIGITEAQRSVFEKRLMKAKWKRKFRNLLGRIAYLKFQQP